MRNLLRPRTFVVAAVAMLLSGGAYAFTASNTVPATAAGNGSNTISGYKVSGVTYTLATSGSTSNSNTTSASAAYPVITGVTFTLTSISTTDTSAPTLVDAVITGTDNTSNATGTATSGTTSVDYSSCNFTTGTSAWNASGTSYTCTPSSSSSYNGPYESVNDATALNVTASDSTGTVSTL